VHHERRRAREGPHGRELRRRPPRFFHRSKREAQEVAAELRPARALPTREVVTVGDRGRPAADLPFASRAVPTTEATFTGTPVAEGAPPVPPATADTAAASGLTVAPDRRDSCAVQPVEPPALSGPVAAPPHPAAVPLPASPGPPVSTAASPPAGTRSHQRDVVEPLDTELRRLHVTVSRRVLAKLDAARDALSHARPKATTEEIIETALDLLLAAHARRKGVATRRRVGGARVGAVASGPVASPDEARAGTAAAVQDALLTPSGPPPAIELAATPFVEPGSAYAPTPPYVPAAVRSAVWQRDGGRCQWPVASGGVCGSTLRLEVDHLVPRALGGQSTIGNLRLLCRFPEGSPRSIACVT
jgi:hypothetical protein